MDTPRDSAPPEGYDDPNSSASAQKNRPKRTYRACQPCRAVSWTRPRFLPIDFFD